MGQTEVKEKVKTDINSIESPKEIYDLFKKLNYPAKVLHDISAKRKKQTFDFKKDDGDRIKDIYSILSFEEKLPVFLIESKTLTPSFVRSVTNNFDKQYLHFLLIFAVDYSEIIFVFPNREKVETGKHKLKITKLVINKKEIHYTDIETLSNICYTDGDTWRDVWRKWRKAFSVERVTDEFFEDYTNRFFSLRNALIKQNVPRKESHEFTLQFLNRVMFIYFISKKNWLSYPKFVGWLWESYKKLGKYGSNEFYRVWLRNIFFKAFNNRADEIKDMPKEIIEVISRAPYLNGGLFRENGLDNLSVFIGDDMFKQIFEFFEKYNFTIKEDMPLDQQVAVDPQMLGYVYESLANIAEEIYDRNDLGIFYTPRVEVDFMCRRPLVEYLSKQLPKVPKEKFYHLIFDLPEEKEKTEKYFDKEKLWHQLKEVLDNLSVIDPACGSGAFLVGMLNVLAEMYRMINKYLKKNVNDFNLKFGIVQRSLYGVDVMPWAIHAAELRLWLQLIVETEFKKEELKKNPLLPNLNLNLRIGDSLVQEIGGLSFNVRTNDLKTFLKKKLDKLKDEKRKYFENSPTAEFKTPEEVRAEEIRLFEEIIEDRISSLNMDIDTHKTSLNQKKSRQAGLFGPAKIETQTDLKQKKDKAKIEEDIVKCEKEIEKLNKIKELLHDPEKKPFIWDIDFAEIFGDKNGFDIVIGNPPYVTRTLISPPNRLKAEVSKEEKDVYKQKLILSVKNRFPVVPTLGKMCDYYIYFYFHGLSLLNEKGTFCFITSNSWLDVEYGKYLQEFLLKYVPIIAIYDNPKKSFSHADINTVITLFGSPKFKEESIGGLKIQYNMNWPMLNHVAKFVMFKKPFEEAINAKNLIAIESVEASIKGKKVIELVRNLINHNDYRVFPIIQEDLLEDGWDYPEDYKDERFNVGNYEGNKWGSKYLRAPDIFYSILNKGKDKLVKLEEIAKVRIGIMTGLNEFFWLEKIRKGSKNTQILKNENGLEIEIENEFIAPAVKSPKELERIKVSEKDVTKSIFLCNLSKQELKNKGFTYALNYITLGEKEGYHRKPFFSGRKNWWDCGKKIAAKLNCNYMVNDQIRFYFKEDGFYVSDNFHEIHTDISPKILGAICNSTLMQLMVNIFGRVTFGGGLIKLQTNDAKRILTLNTKIITKKKMLESLFLRLSIHKIGGFFEELGIDSSKPIREQEPKPLKDRAELDKIVFDELGLTKEERKEVYWSVCELVKQRLEKAKSLKND